jgi:hypothetical protein
LDETAETETGVETDETDETEIGAGVWMEVGLKLAVQPM